MLRGDSETVSLPEPGKGEHEHFLSRLPDLSHLKCNVLGTLPRPLLSKLELPKPNEFITLSPFSLQPTEVVRQSLFLTTFASLRVALRFQRDLWCRAGMLRASF
eukprot:3935496-Rhodomonas_salina.2